LDQSKGTLSIGDVLVFFLTDHSERLVTDWNRG